MSKEKDKEPPKEVLDVDYDITDAVGSKPPETAQLQSVMFSQHEGPLPHPQIYSEYEKVLPGAAEKLMQMSLESHQHIMFCEKETIKNDYKLKTRGQRFGMSSVFLAFVTSGLLGFFNHPTAASIIGGATLVSIVAIFITGRSK